MEDQPSVRQAPGPPPLQASLFLLETDLSEYGLLWPSSWAVDSGPLPSLVLGPVGRHRFGKPNKPMVAESQLQCGGLCMTCSLARHKSHFITDIRRQRPLPSPRQGRQGSQQAAWPWQPELVGRATVPSADPWTKAEAELVRGLCYTVPWRSVGPWVGAPGPWEELFGHPGPWHMLSAAGQAWAAAALLVPTGASGPDVPSSCGPHRGVYCQFPVLWDSGNYSKG